MQKSINPITFQHISELIRKNECVFFIGAGISHTDADFPSGNMLKEILAKELNLNPSHFTLPSLASKYQAQFDRVRLITLFRDNLDKRIDINKKGVCKILKKICKLPITTIITTNYDNLIESVFEAKQNVINVIKTDKQISTWREDCVQLLKIHGDFSVDPDKIVITNEDYSAYINNYKSMIIKLQDLFNTKNIIFLGYSLNDVNFKSIHHIVVENLGGLKRKCYAFSRDRLPEKEIEDWHMQNLDILNSEAYDFVKELVKQYYYIPKKTESKIEKVIVEPRPTIMRPCFKNNGKFLFRKRFAFNIGIRTGFLKDYYFYYIVLDSMIFEPAFLTKSKLNNLVSGFSDILSKRLTDLSRKDYYLENLHPIFEQNQKDRKRIIKHANLIIILVYDNRYSGYINSLYGPVSKWKKFVLILHRNFNKRLDTDLVLIGLKSLGNHVISFSSSSLKDDRIVEEIHRLILLEQNNRLQSLILSESLENEE